MNEIRTPKARAHAIGMEWIDSGGEACLRQAHFDGDGLRVVRMFPDPCEFEPRDDALAKLAAAESKRG